MSDREAKAVHLIDDIRNLIAEYDRGEPRVVRVTTAPLPILREDVDDHYGGVAPAGRRVYEPDGTVTEPDRGSLP